MPVIKGAGESYEIGTGRIVAPGTEPPAWFTANLDMQVTDGGGDAKCLELKAKASQCMQERGAYSLCAEIVEAYNLCFARALQSRLPPREVQQLEALRKNQQQHSEADALQQHMAVVRRKYEQTKDNQATFAMGAAETSTAIAEASAAAASASSQQQQSN